MALPDILAARLIQAVKTNEISGAALMLGRQKWVGTRKLASARLFARVMKKYLPGISEAELKNTQDIYCEPFFEKLGFDQVDSLDVSDFEGATVVHDLTAAPRDDLREQYDLIYDGGTCEHIFDLPSAFANIDAMLKPGGVVVGHNPCNRWIVHGFYQFSPELVFGYWQRAMGYEVLHLRLQPMLPAFATRTVTVTTNPNETGFRPKLSGDVPDNSPIILDYAVRKPLAAAPFAEAPVHQSDYIARWDRMKKSA